MALLSVMSLVASAAMRIMPQTEPYFASNALGWILDVFFRRILTLVMEALFSGLVAA